MKTLRLKHNVEFRNSQHFVAVGVGVDYIDWSTYKGIFAQDIAQLIYTEQIWFNVPLSALDRKGYVGNSPFGFKFSHPIILEKGKHLKFYTNQSTSADTVHLVFYGYPITEFGYEQIVQKRPMKMIYMRGFNFEASVTSMRLEVPHAYDLLSFGFLYSLQDEGMLSEEYVDLPDSVLGYLEVLGKKYNFDSDQLRALNLLSDLHLGYRSRVNDFNLYRFEMKSEDCLNLHIDTALAGTESMYTLVEYEKVDPAEEIKREVIEKTKEAAGKTTTETSATPKPFKFPSAQSERVIKLTPAASQ